jgi:heavy metal sensor kinase
MKIKSLSFKLTIWYTVILAIIIAISGMFLYQRFKDSLTTEMEKKLSNIASTTYKNWWSKKGVSWQDAITISEGQFKMCQPFIQVVLLPDEKEQKNIEFLHSSNISGEILHLDQAHYREAKAMGRDNPQFLAIPVESLSSFPMRVILYSARRNVVIQVGLSMESTINNQRRLLIILIISGPLLLLFASIGGNFIIRRALRPVQSVVQTAHQISADDLSMRIDSGGRQDEIGQLVDTFNQMISRLERSVQRIRQFSGDVSHELRTPLTIIRGEIEVILRKERNKAEYQEILRSILEETQQMENIINDLLLLSQVRSVHKKMIMEKFPLHHQLKQVVEKFKSGAAGKQIQIELTKNVPVHFIGKQTLIERMITNVIDNALRYTSSGGSVDIALTKNEKFAELRVRDTGIGIPDEALSSIFERFYVVDKSRSKENGGTGLGLSIVKWIADNHDIQIHIDSTPGKGTTFIFSFPLTNPLPGL